MKDPYSKSVKEPKDNIMGGYIGNDPMRSKAREMMKYDLEDSITTPESYSAPDKTKMRYYKKGGGVEKGQKVRKINKDHYQMAKHIDGKKAPNITVEKAVQLKKGGKVKEGRQIKGLIMKKGGVAKMADGGMFPQVRMSPGIGGAMKKGGLMKKATGGNVYERHMLGEHPSKKAPHINYESEMRGEKPVKRKMADGGMVDGANMMKKGGATKKAAGGPAKMAMGGATKMNRRDGIYSKKTKCDYSK